MPDIYSLPALLQETTEAAHRHQIVRHKTNGCELFTANGPCHPTDILIRTWKASASIATGSLPQELHCKTDGHYYMCWFIKYAGYLGSARKPNSLGFEMIIPSSTCESEWSQDEHSWVPWLSHDPGDSCTLYQGTNLPQKWTAKENTCPEKQTREIKKNICENEVVLSVGGKALKILSCQCPRCWQISLIAQHVQVSMWPEEQWAGLQVLVIEQHRYAEGGKVSEILLFFDPVPAHLVTTLCRSPTLLVLLKWRWVQCKLKTCHLLWLAVILEGFFAIRLKKLWRNRWQRSTEASEWPRFDVAALGVLVHNVMQQDILLLHSAFANLREQDSVMFPPPSSQLHFKTVFYLLLVILENFLQ